MKIPIVASSSQPEVKLNDVTKMVTIKWMDTEGNLGGVSLNVTSAIMVGLDIRSITLELARAEEEREKIQRMTDQQLLTELTRRGIITLTEN